MTEKRFSLFEDLDIKDEVTGKIYPPCLDKGLRELVDLLNQLNEENEQLKYNLSAYMVDLNNYKGKCSALEKENEQLKQQWKEKRHEDINELSVIAMKYKALENENEQLKQQIKELEKFKHFIFKSLNHIYEDKE